MAEANAIPNVRPIGFDRQYLSTISGKINLSLVVLNGASFLSGVLTFLWILGAKGWFCFVTGAGFWLDLFVFLVAILRFEDRLNRFPKWKQVIMYERCLWTGFYLIAAIVAAISTTFNFVLIIPTIFGFGTTAAYAGELFLRYRDYKGTPIGR